MFLNIFRKYNHFRYICFVYFHNRNYGPTILAQRHAEMQGLQQVLWLYGEERQVRKYKIREFFV